MQFDITILGSGSATPTATRHPSSQAICISDRWFLVDCGEGTQMQLRRCGIRMQRISQVFISHLHGDHYFGLIGLITSMSLLGRLSPLHIWSPKGLEEIIRIQLQLTDNRLSYELVFHELNTAATELVFEDKLITVHAFPLYHRIPCCGFVFREKERERNILKEAVARYNFPLNWMVRIKAGEDYVTGSGERIPNSSITRDPLSARSYAYCSDTAYNKEVAKVVQGVDLLYHEATFGEEYKERAKFTFHSTAAEAAQIASEAGVRKLLIGHFSARYKDTAGLVEEASAIFPESYAAEEEITYSIPLRHHR